MHNPYRGGTPDVWYSHKRGDLWVEYKYIGKIPRKGRVVPALSPLQKKWLRDRHHEGRRVAVVVGCPAGAVLFTRPVDWEPGLPVDTFAELLCTRADLALWIAS